VTALSNKEKAYGTKELNLSPRKYDIRKLFLLSLFAYFIQWKPLNGISVNVIIWLMWSISQTHVAFLQSTDLRACSVNVINCAISYLISFSLSKSFHIKMLPLYLIIFYNFEERPGFVRRLRPLHKFLWGWASTESPIPSTKCRSDCRVWRVEPLK